MGKWALPGGFIEETEHMDDAASRVLKDRTGIEDIFLNQFHCFGRADRIEKNHAKLLAKNEVIQTDQEEWFSQRFVTVGYYALLEYSKVRPMPDVLSSECTWHAMDALPEMIIDHKAIIEKALLTLRIQISYQPIGQNLLPEKFTMSELQALYETILGKELDRRNFQRKILGYDILKRLNEQRKGGAHRAPYLFIFNDVNYKKALEEGLTDRW